MITDSHCHLPLLFDKNFGEVSDIIESSKNYGVTRMLTIAIDISSWDASLSIAEQYEEVYVALGVHPCTEKSETEDKSYLIELKKLAYNPNVLAIGEIGLDYHYEQPIAANNYLEWQKKRFIEQLNVAKFLEKPVVIHNRNSSKDLYKILHNHYGNCNAGGIMHCFVENLQTAMKAIEMGFYISFSGILTFKTSHELREVAKQIPLDKILVETDAPYLAPQKVRGQSNHPAYTAYVVQTLADIKNMPVEKIAEITSNNFNKLFKIKTKIIK